MPQEQDIIKKDPLEAFHKMKSLLYCFMVSISFLEMPTLLLCFII
jgi:hypothetical protein